MTDALKPISVIDLGETPFTLWALDRMALELRTNGQVTIRGCSHIDLIELGMVLMAKYDKMKNHG